MGRKAIPSRWGNYLPMGCRVPGTRFLPFKVPLKMELCKSQPEDGQFTPSLLLESTPMLKAVIDLTNTDRYYNSKEFTDNGVSYRKVHVQGGGKLPSDHELKQFFDAVDQLCETLRHDSDALIGVHCTHGLNRTGYLICKYMVSRMKIDPQEAINKFQEARGHKIERNNYVNDIMDQITSEVNWRNEPRFTPRRANREERALSSSSRPRVMPPERNREERLFQSLSRPRLTSPERNREKRPFSSSSRPRPMSPERTKEERPFSLLSRPRFKSPERNREERSFSSSSRPRPMSPERTREERPFSLLSRPRFKSPERNREERPFLSSSRPRPMSPERTREERPFSLLSRPRFKSAERNREGRPFSSSSRACLTSPERNREKRRFSSSSNFGRYDSRPSYNHHNSRKDNNQEDITRHRSGYNF